MAKSCVKKCSTLITREMQINTMKYYLTTVTIAIVKTTKVLTRLWEKGNFYAELVGI